MLYHTLLHYIIYDTIYYNYTVLLNMIIKSSLGRSLAVAAAREASSPLTRFAPCSTLHAKSEGCWREGRWSEECQEVSKPEFDTF